MPSTFSTNLKIELMSTGENSGTWGTVTNTNLGTALEQAVVGYGNPNYSSDANLTITLTDSNASQAARALVLNVTSGVSLTATRELVVPTIQKQYIVQNNTTGSQSITVKTSSGTGITVPNGRKAHLYVDGTNVIQMFDFVDINGGAIDGTTVGAASASTGAFTTLTASGATTLNGAVALGDAAADLITVPGTVNSNVIFTDNTYDIGASGATRPRTIYAGTSIFAPLMDATNLEVTNIKALDGTAAASIANSTGAITVSTLLNVDNLRLDGNTLSSTDSNGNVVLAPNGTGDVQLDADTVRIGDSNANATLTTNGTGDLILNTNSGTNSGSITIQDGVDGNIIIAPNGNGQVQITNAVLDLTTIEVTNIRAKDGTAAMSIADSTGAVTVSTLLNVDNLRLDGNTLSSTNTNGAINLTPNGTGQVTVTNDALINSITVGRGAGAVSTNTVVGNTALAVNTTGSRNTAVGYFAALYATGSSNTAFGISALAGSSGTATGSANTAIGDAALTGNTSGSYNTAIGSNALNANAAASNNTAVGYQALFANTTASNNTAVGYQSMLDSTGGNNTALGFQSLQTNNAGGSNNVAIGYQANRNNTSGIYNVSVGLQSLLGNTFGGSNTALGYQTLFSSTTANNNTAVGYQAGYSNIRGENNTFVGAESAISNTASNNSALGFRSLYANTTGALNVAVGVRSLAANTFGDGNSSFGYEALRFNTTGANNAAGGYQALYTNQTGSRSTAFGTNALTYSTVSDNTAIGYFALYTNTTGLYNLAVGGGDGATGSTLSNNSTGSYNTALGFQALKSNTTASNNTAVGYQAGFSNTTASNNTALGFQSLAFNTTGVNNIAVGAQAGFNNTTGIANVFVGKGSGFANTFGDYNNAVGANALSSNTTGALNTAMGESALLSNTTGNYNTAVGGNALRFNTFASNNTAVGYLAGYSNTTGANNTAIGFESLRSNTLANYNTAVGYQAGYSNVAGVGNTFIGTQAGLSHNTSGNTFNTFIGYYSGYSTTGSSNTFVGEESGYLITSGAKNTIIGRYNGNQNSLDIRTASNYIVLSDGDGNPRGVFDNSGNFTLGVAPNDAQMTAANTMKLYTATKTVSTGATTNVFSITLPGADSFAVLNYEIVTSLGSPQGSGNVTSGQIAISRTLYAANADATVTQAGFTTSNGNAGCMTSVQVSGTTAPSGNTVTFSITISTFVPNHNQTSRVYLWSRSTNLTVAAV